MLDNLLRIRDVIEATGKSRSAIYTDIAAGNFPRPVPIGKRSVAWPTSAIAKWIESKVTSASQFA